MATKKPKHSPPSGAEFIQLRSYLVEHGMSEVEVIEAIGATHRGRWRSSIAEIIAAYQKRYARKEVKDGRKSGGAQALHDEIGQAKAGAPHAEVGASLVEARAEPDDSERPQAGAQALRPYRERKKK